MEKRDVLTPNKCTQDNFAGDIPKWLINFATKKGVPSFLKALEKAAVQVFRSHQQL
jgi:hypothetical protein